LNERNEKIHEKGFDMIDPTPATEYKRIKVGVKQLDDAVLKLGSL
jgi:hypothetical protein